MSLFGALFFTIVIANHYFFRTTTFDYGTFNFELWDYAHFRISRFPFIYWVKVNLLQDHFTFLLMYFIPIYWIINWLTCTYTLDIITIIFILWSGWATYKLILLKSGDGWLGIGSLLYSFLLFGRYSAFSVDGHIGVIIPCFIPVFLYYFESRKYVLSAFLFILTLFSREDMGLCFFFIFIVLLIWHWKEKKLVRMIVLYMFVSLVYFILVFKILIPMVNTPDKQYSMFNFSALGSDPGSAFIFILKHPVKSIKMLFVNHLDNPLYNGIKVEFYKVYLISGGFVLFFRPQYIIWFIPLIAQKMWNDDPIRWSIETYYSTPTIAMLPISVFVILSNLKVKKLNYFLTVIICILTLYETIHKMNPDYHLLWSNTRAKGDIFEPEFFHPPFDAKKIHSDLNLIPDDAKVCASESILPHLSQRRCIYEFPDIEDADYIAIFAFHDWYRCSEKEYFTQRDKIICSAAWNLIANDFPFLLFKKEENIHGNMLHIDSILCTADLLNSDKLQFISSDNELFDNGNTQDTVIMHNGHYTIHLSKEKPYGFTFHGTKFNTGNILIISAWKYPATRGFGSLVVSCGKNFYWTESSGELKDGNGWEQIQMDIVVPEDHKDFKIYAWNNGYRDVWFDGLKIIQIAK